MPIERRLWRENPSARALLYGAVGLAFLAAALWLALAVLLSLVVDRVFLHHQTLDDVAALLALMLALLVTRAALQSANDVFAQHAANRVKGDLRRRLAAKLIALGPAYTRGERTGELVHVTMEGVEALDEYISRYQAARLLAGLVPVLVCGVIFVVDPWTLPILLFAGPVLLVLLALIGGRTRELTQRRFSEMSWMSAHFLDMLQGLTTLKLFGRSKEQAATIETISLRYGNTTMDVLRTAFQSSLVLEWGATAATALVAIEVSVRLMAGQLAFGRALTVLLLTPEFFLPMRQLAISYHAGSAGKAAAERIYAILDTPVAAAQGSQVADRANLTSVLPVRLDLRFDDVDVAYETGRRLALSGFTLNIAEGQMVALIGPTGAGKTTVANLLLRFIEPVRGRITVGGSCLSDIDPARWRSLVAWVSQQPHLFHGTIAENLRLARPGASADALIAAARAAHAHDFISALPHGYDTFIGERGARLSGGQRQRLAIARAFLKDAPLLILDEATSHLDSESEELVREALSRLMQGRTVLIIAHRPKLVRDADLIVAMDAGQIVQTGSPHTLANESGLFRRLVAAGEEVTS
jgi:ATP-binding cassette subfamily C protein CydD